jgi:hypothetical protein
MPPTRSPTKNFIFLCPWGEKIFCLVFNTFPNLVLQEFKVKKELVKNAKWSLLEGELSHPHRRLLVLVYTPAEVMRVGLTKIRKAHKLLEKQNANQKIALFDSITLHTNFNQNVAIVFHYTGEYTLLATISPISSAKDYLSVAHAIVSYFWELHKNRVVYNNLNINLIVMLKIVDNGWRMGALDMLEALESTSIVSYRNQQFSR